MRKFYLLLISLFWGSSAQATTHDLVGYWHNWDDVNAPYIQLNQVDARYTVIELAFATPTSSTDMTMLFSPTMVSSATLISQIQSLQAQGKKVLISIGGATGTIDLTTSANKTAFISSMTGILNTYGLDGLDLDIENGASILASGTITNPTSTAQLNLIDAVKQIMQTYHNTYNKKMFLTMAPETAYVQGGMSAFGGIWGGYLPIIHALRDSLDILQVQLYNSGSMMGIDNNLYNPATADFISSMTEAVITGFNTSGGFFFGLAANQVAVGLPACGSAAGSGYITPTVVKQAVDYVRGTGPNPGSYIMAASSGYLDLRGMMTWSINWDAIASCASAYEYAANYQVIFGTPTYSSDASWNATVSIYPNPIQDYMLVELTMNNHAEIEIMNLQGQIILRVQAHSGQQKISTTSLAKGLYILRCGSATQKFLKE